MQVAGHQQMAGVDGHAELFHLTAGPQQAGGDHVSAIEDRRDTADDDQVYRLEVRELVADGESVVSASPLGVGPSFCSSIDV